MEQLEEQLYQHKAGLLHCCVQAHTSKEGTFMLHTH